MSVTDTFREGATQERAPGVTDEFEFSAKVRQILNRRPAVGLALGVVRDRRLEFFHGHGVADIASNTPITEDTVFRIASISKTFAAIAVMQLWEQGLVDLDAPANDYLRAYRLIPAKASSRPATVKHLLTHTAGVPQMVHPSHAFMSGWFGESFGLGQPLPTLAEYYRGGLRLAAEPGTTFTYTDHGFATLGQIVEDVSGKPLDLYLRDHVFEPLGMSDTDLARSEHVVSRLATGYNLRSHGVRAVTDRQWVTAAASSIYSTPRDMARLPCRPPRRRRQRVQLDAQTRHPGHDVRAHYQPDPRVPGIGLGFFRVDLGGHLALEHQGILPGFNSQILFAPDDGVAVMAFTNGARQPLMWLTAEVGRLLSHLIGVSDEVLRNDVPQHAEIWGDICGWYRPRAQLTDIRRGPWSAPEPRSSSGVVSSCFEP